MVTRGRGRLDAQARRLEKASLCELPLIFSGWVELNESAFAVFRERIFTVSRTFWLFLYQVFLTEASCAEVVRKALIHLILKEDVIASTSSSAYCQARKRLPQELVDAVSRSLTERLRAEEGRQVWHGRDVKVIDGSSASMPDTPENQMRFPKPASRKSTTSFPVMRLVCIFSLASGAVLKCLFGPLSDHERTLWRRLWSELKRGDIVLADRGFCGFADYALLLRKGVDCVMRLNAKRSAGIIEIKRIGRGDYLVEWVKSKAGSRPQWLTIKEWKALPDRLRVRHVTFHVDVPGFRTKVITVATTLLDPKLYPARDFSRLFYQRWKAELYLRDIKISLGMDPLRCKTPDMVIKELTMYLIAYNLIRALMFRASLQHSIAIDALSFKQSLATVRQWAPAMEEAVNPTRHLALLDLLLYYLAVTIVPNRPGRTEPRAKKRRPRNYQLLNKPRRDFCEIKHRNRHAKALS